jgi:Zn-dependent protease
MQQRQRGAIFQLPEQGIGKLEACPTAHAGNPSGRGDCVRIPGMIRFPSRVFHGFPLDRRALDMRDPFTWSFPIGRLFGIAIKIHVLFPVVALGLILRAASVKDVLPGTWVDALAIVGLLFLSVLLHEFGHCFGARLMDGDAREVLIWPLGGLASVEVPHTPRANFVTAMMGPVVNLLLCVVTGVLLLVAVDPGLQPLWDPTAYPYRTWTDGSMTLYQWDGDKVAVADTWALFLTRLFYVNWLLLLFNLVLIGFPMDSGRMLQCILWPRFGYTTATRAAVFCGFVTMFVLIVVCFWVNESIFLGLALFIFLACRQQWILLETGGEDSVFGYDFSQGYTSLERDQPPPPRKRRPGFFQRWLQRRAAKKHQREIETRAAEEQRMDELLEKIQREGKQALTDEENRFLKRVADKYRNRQ